jgi:hypothetical protein
MVLLHAIPVTLFILALFYYWFAVADRYAVFLYNHRLAGPAGPFDDITIGRYWMSGLVADGAVMLLYIAANWLLARVGANDRAPAWWRVWLLCAPLLIVGIPIITMTTNSPTLPPALAAACVVATLAGLAFALMPGALAARQLPDLAWLALDGVGLVPSLLLLRAIELPGRGLAVSASTAYLVAVGSILGGAVWLGAMSVLRVWQRKPSPNAVSVFVAGLCLSYLALPLAHYLFFTPAAYRYIGASSNFFMHNLGLQLVTFLIAAALAFGAARFRNSRFSTRLTHQRRTNEHRHWL